MTARIKLNLEVNQPVRIQLLYDECVSGTNQYGPYYMYAVKVIGNGEEEYTYFAPQEVHEQLKNLKRTDEAVITKLAATRGNRLVIRYDVTPATEKSVSKPMEKDIDEEEDSYELGSADDKVDPPQDNLKQVLYNCFNDSIALQKELNGMIDIEKTAITLFIARTKGK